MKRTVLAAVVTLGLVCTVWTSMASAQAVYGSIAGTLTDPAGAAVNGAKITVTSVSKGSVVETTTNADGNYSVGHLIPDVYTIRGEAGGFKAFEAKNITVTVDTLHASRWPVSSGRSLRDSRSHRRGAST